MPTSIYDINRKHTINNQYFENITTQDQAYWLGFIWADGSISQTAKRCSGKNRLTLAQKADEKDHLQKFANSLNSNATISIRTPFANKQIASISINSRPICQQLEQLGYGNKQERIHVPNIPKPLLRHFIRGYFDGDGCLSIYEQQVKQWTINRQEWSITGTQELLKEIKEILNQDTTVSPNVKLKTYNRTSKVVSLRYGRKADINTLYHYMYDNASIYLESKHQKFLEFYSKQP